MYGWHMWLGWWGPVIFVAMFVATCVWMAASEQTPGWGWVALKYILGIPLIVGAMFVVIWAWDGLSKT